MYVLKRTDICPPGSFPYEQPERKFGATSDIESQASIVADFRKGNGLPRATKEEAAQDIDVYTCQRLGNMPQYCRDTEGKPYVSPIAPPGGGRCGTCGAKV